MGWINTRILPRKIKDTEDRISEIEVAINVKSDTLFNRNNVGLVYSFNGFITSDTLNMIASGPDDFFVRKIGIPGYNTKMDYYSMLLISSQGSQISFIMAEETIYCIYRSRHSKACNNPYKNRLLF
jgi:hypothetical protein